MPVVLARKFHRSPQGEQLQYSVLLVPPLRAVTDTVFYASKLNGDTVRFVQNVAILAQNRAVCLLAHERLELEVVDSCQ